MPVPELGTYVSEDNNFEITIHQATPAQGVIKAQYTAHQSPQGPFTEGPWDDYECNGVRGRYFWVGKYGRNGIDVAPFCIRFEVTKRSPHRDRPKYPYCILDSWAGSYREDDTLLLGGVRSYVTDRDVIEVTSLGTLVFSRRP